jgi:hypothetical protein
LQVNAAAIRRGALAGPSHLRAGHEPDVGLLRDGLAACQGAVRLLDGRDQFEDTDGYSVADGSNQAITIPAGLGGKYNVTVWVASTAATAVGKVEIIRAGVSTLGAQSICVGGTDTTVARQVTLGAGDVITLKVTNGSASTTFNVTVELWRESE